MAVISSVKPTNPIGVIAKMLSLWAMTLLCLEVLIVDRGNQMCLTDCSVVPLWIYPIVFVLIYQIHVRLFGLKRRFAVWAMVSAFLILPLVLFNLTPVTQQLIIKSIKPVFESLSR